MFIDGEWCDAADGETIEATSPATGESLGTVAEGGREDARRAIAAANAAFPAWSARTGFERAELIHRVADACERRSDELAHSSLRMTIGRWTTEEEIDYAIATIKENVAKLRELSPLWEMFKDGVDLSTIQWAAH